jgi:hypothetical protein
MRPNHPDDYERERDLDRAAEQEPDAFRARPERAPRVFFFDRSQFVDRDTKTDNLEQLWRPSDGAL